MTDASKIVDKILPEKKYREYNQHLTAGDWYACNFCGAMGECKCCEIYNQALTNIRQHLLSTYGKEWVGVPKGDDI